MTAVGLGVDGRAVLGMIGIGLDVGDVVGATDGHSRVQLDIVLQ